MVLALRAGREPAPGLTLAHSHARTGDVVATAGYIGRGESLIRAVVEFANAYADQNERDFAIFIQALKQGEIQQREEVPMVS